MANEKHLIDGEGQIYCPVRRRIVDVERCLSCRRLVDYDVDARRPFVVCRGPEETPPTSAP